jgi:SRSO17 transposase
VEWPQESAEPIQYFLLGLACRLYSAPIGASSQARWKIEQDYQQLTEELGLDYYEGRSWKGWHHQVTLVMLAHSFLTLEPLRNKKNYWVDPAEDAREIQRLLCIWTGSCCHCGRPTRNLTE